MSSWLTPDMVERRQHKSLMALPAIEAYVDSHGGFSVDEDSVTCPHICIHIQS